MSKLFSTVSKTVPQTIITDEIKPEGNKIVRQRYYYTLLLCRCRREVKLKLYVACNSHSSPIYIRTLTLQCRNDISFYIYS